jgi:transposase
LVSHGHPGPDRRLSCGQIDRLAEHLQAGPAAAGYTDDQRWTLARVSALIGTLLRVRLPIAATARLLHAMGWTPQQPVHRAAQRDEAAIARWRRYQWPAVGSRAGWARTCVSKTSAA